MSSPLLEKSLDFAAQIVLFYEEYYIRNRLRFQHVTGM